MTEFEKDIKYINDLFSDKSMKQHRDEIEEEFSSLYIIKKPETKEQLTFFNMEN